MTSKSAHAVNEFWSAPGDALFDERVVAQVLGVSRAWCQRARWRGGGPRFFKIGRSVRYRKADIHEWMGKPLASTTEGGCEA